MSPADVILTCVSMTLAVGASVCAWDAHRQALRADEAHERARVANETSRTAYAEIKRLRDRDADAMGVIKEWQRGDGPNNYLVRVHRALRPPVSGDARKVDR